jgi:hypothetical protein
MSSYQVEKESLKIIQKRQLSAVTFIMDYLEIQFDGDTLTIFTSPSIFDEIGSIKWLTPGFRDRICGFITKVVKIVDIFESEIFIEFEDMSTIIIPLTGSYPGEAVIFTYGIKRNLWVLHKIGPEKDN